MARAGLARHWRLFHNKRMQSFIFSFLLILGMGCASNSIQQHMPPEARLLPPEIPLESQSDIENVDFYLQKAAETQSTREYQWWISYKRAAIWQEKKPNFSCEHFSLLARDPLFPMAQIAYLRSFEICPKDSEHLSGLKKFDWKSFPEWMQKAALEVALNKAAREQNLTQEMELSYEKSKEYLPTEKKVQLTQRALQIAEKLENKKFARKMKDRLYKLRPSENPRPTRSQWLSVAYDHRRQRDFKQSRKYYRKILGHKRFKFSTKLKAWYGLRKAYKNDRDHEGHLKVTREMARFAESFLRKYPKSNYFKKKFHDTHVALARTEWTRGHVKQAGKTLARIERKLRGKYTMNEVFWLFGRMDEEKGRFKKAHYWFERALKEKVASADFKEKLMWYKAWTERKMEKHDQAIGSLEDLIKITENDFARSRYRFWLAKSWASKGESTRSRLEFQTLINEDPLGYYGMVAHHETGQLIPANEKILDRLPAKDETKFPLDKIVDTQLIEWLISLEEHDLSKRYLNEVSIAFRKRKDQTDEAWFRIFNYYARAGEYLSLYEQLGRLSPERRKELLDRHPSLIFPQPFESLVTNASRQFGVSAELLYSIMRQESAFNPRARSFADAFGLLQMLPEVARKEASVAKVTYEKPEDLYKPEVNIPVGAAFIKKLQTKWNDQFILTVASYNANDRAIHGWLKTRYRGDTLEFIEDIPYEETRGYVRLVMRNLIFYSLLNADGEKIAFPANVLKMEPPQSI